MATTVSTSVVYGASALRRRRLTKAELEELENRILETAEEEKPISVRGLFYRVTSAAPHLIDKSESGYRKVQQRALALRRRGVLPYGWISDGTRLRLKPQTWDSVDECLAATSASYRRNMWIDSPDHVEIWAEKDAIRGVVYPVTHSWDVPLLIARGYSSDTFIHATAAEINASGKRHAFIYQLGDHDPSGVGAWDDVRTKLRNFVTPAIEMTFERLAVTPEQIDTLSLPTRPTKKSDTRSKNFKGDSVEVDAVPTPTLRQLVDAAIGCHVDDHALDLHSGYEAQERAFLEKMIGGRND